MSQTLKRALRALVQQRRLGADGGGNYSEYESPPAKTDSVNTGCGCGGTCPCKTKKMKIEAPPAV